MHGVVKNTQRSFVAGNCNTYARVHLDTVEHIVRPLDPLYHLQHDKYPNRENQATENIRIYTLRLWRKLP